MTHDDQSTRFEELLQLLSEHGFDGMAEAIEILLNEAMKLERAEVLGAMPYQRTEARRGYANGFKPKTVNSRLGRLRMQVPQTRDVEFYPSALERGERSERALKLAVAEMYVQGVSTRRVEDLVETLGIASLSKSQVSRMCAALDAEVETFRNRPLTEETYPYLWLDATYLKVREAGRVVSMAALVATGVAASGERRILGLELAPGNDEGSAWPAFVRGLVERGLSGVRLVISDDHRGLVKAVHEQLLGAAWQRCRVHFTRNAQDLVPRSARGMVATIIRSVFEQPDEASAREQLRRAVDGLTERFPKVAELLVAAETDLLVHLTFPEAHRPRIRSTNPLERLNKEIKRRTQVVGIFPTRASVIRLVGMILAEQDDEWQDGRCYFRPESMALIDAMTPQEEETPALLMAS